MSDNMGTLSLHTFICYGNLFLRFMDNENFLYERVFLNEIVMKEVYLRRSNQTLNSISVWMMNFLLKIMKILLQKGSTVTLAVTLYKFVLPLSQTFKSSTKQYFYLDDEFFSEGNKNFTPKGQHNFLGSNLAQMYTHQNRFYYVSQLNNIFTYYLHFFL